MGRTRKENQKRNNGAFGNGHPRAVEKENLKPGKRNVEGKKHLGLRKKETMNLLTKKPQRQCKERPESRKKRNAWSHISSKKTI